MNSRNTVIVQLSVLLNSSTDSHKGISSRHLPAQIPPEKLQTGRGATISQSVIRSRYRSLHSSKTGGQKDGHLHSSSSSSIGNNNGSCINSLMPNNDRTLCSSPHSLSTKRDFLDPVVWRLPRIQTVLESSRRLRLQHAQYQTYFLRTIYPVRISL
jgi:hypothetical protein